PSTYRCSTRGTGLYPGRAMRSTLKQLVHLPRKHHHHHQRVVGRNLQQQPLPFARCGYSGDWLFLLRDDASPVHVLW
ncbi:hypothetical protein ElyMa_006128400, partial [Elysia marginata]